MGAGRRHRRGWGSAFASSGGELAAADDGVEAAGGNLDSVEVLGRQEKEDLFHDGVAETIHVLVMHGDRNKQLIN